jgi:nucleoid-associated protein YgaU
MGLITFIKSVGAKLHGASEDKPATPEILKQEVAKQGLPADQINLAVSGNTVTVTGKAASTEEAEKIALTVGNSLGVSQVANSITVEKPSPEAKMYTVQKGDNLSRIAEAQYGKGKANEYHRIFDANKPMLKNPDLIYPDQVLRIAPFS